LLVGQNSTIESCLITEISFINTDDKDRSVGFGAGPSNTAKFNNCVFRNIHTSAEISDDDHTVYIYGSVNNCVVENWTFDLLPGVSGGIGHSYGSFYNSLIDNSGLRMPSSLSSNFFNCMLKTSEYVDQSRYNQAVNGNCIFNYDFGPDMVAGEYRVAENTIPKESGTYPNTKMGTLNQIDYWPYGWYDVGPLYYKKDTLVLTQNNQSIVLRVN
jgi:hypothetical protein